MRNGEKQGLLDVTHDFIGLVFLAVFAFLLLCAFGTLYISGWLLEFLDKLRNR